MILPYPSVTLCPGSATNPSAPPGAGYPANAATVHVVDLQSDQKSWSLPFRHVESLSQQWALKAFVVKMGL